MAYMTRVSTLDVQILPRYSMCYFTSPERGQSYVYNKLIRFEALHLGNSNRLRRPGLRTFSHTERGVLYPAENHLKSICGHFIRIIRGKVYLVHRTLENFCSMKLQGGYLVDDSYLPKTEQYQRF